MSYSSLGRTMQRRSIQQANHNTETHQAVVKLVYKDSQGNVLAADLRMTNSGNDLIKVPNRTSLRLVAGDRVLLSFVNGSKHFRQITAAVGAGAIDSANALINSNSTINTPLPLPVSMQLSGYPFLVQEPNSDLAGAYVETPDANVYFTDYDPVLSGSGGTLIPGKRYIAAKPLTGTSLPIVPVSMNLPDETCFDLHDSYGNPLGMYRWDLAAAVWRRRDAGSGGSLPVATPSTLGGVKIGSGLSVTTDGTLSAAGGLPTPTQDSQMLFSVGGAWVAGTPMVNDQGAIITDENGKIVFTIP